MSSRSDWCYVCGWVSAQTDQLMDERTVTALLEAPTVEELTTRFRNSLLFAESPPEDRPYEEVLERFREIAETIGRAAPEARIADLFARETVWARFREFAKRQLAPPGEAGPPKRERGVDIYAEVFESCWQGVADEPGLQPFADAAEAVRLAAESETDDIPGLVDRVMDAHEDAAMIRAAEAIGGTRFCEWVRDLVLLRAGLALVRARGLGWNAERILAAWEQAGIAHEALRDLALKDQPLWSGAFEALGLADADLAWDEADAPVELARRLDAYLTERVEEAVGFPFGPEPVFAFLWRLRNEAMNLRLAYAAVTSGMPVERLTEELRI